MTNLTQSEARSLTDRIVAHVVDLQPLIKEAYERRADLALGYRTWAEYCDAEIKGIRMPIETRRETVRELGEAGMPYEAIGSALGVDRQTVANDLQTVSTREFSRVETERKPRVTKGLDGKERVIMPRAPKPDDEAIRQSRVAAALLSNTAFTLAQMDGSHTGSIFDPARCEELQRPVSQDTVIAAIETLDKVLAAMRERNLP